MRSKVGILLLLSSLASLGACQDRVTLTFPTDTEREAWIASSMPQEAPKDSVISSKSQLELVPSKFSVKEPAKVWVWDKSTGNLASRPLADVKKDGTWTVKPEAFKDIAMVRVSVLYAGKPVAAGEVTLNDGRHSVSQLLDPSVKGELSFFGIKPGSTKVSVKYRNKGTTATVTQIFEVPFDRKDPVPSFVVSVSSETATVSEEKPMLEKGSAPNEPSKPAGAPPAKADPNPPANPIGSFIATLLAFGIAAGVVLFLLQYAKKNPALVQSKLEQMGVQIPKPGDNEPITPAVPAGIPAAKPVPQQKIILDGAGVDPITLASASTAVSDPKLVSDAGDAMMLPEGETVVGRDVGLGLSLVGESTVSRRHAALVRMGASVTVNDLGSTNGTTVNGRKVAIATPLRNGDQVQFGSVRFRFEG